MSLISDLLGTQKNKEESGTLHSKNAAVPVLPKEIYQSAKLQLQDVLAPAALEIKSKSIKLAGKTSRTFFVMSYPRYLSDGWLAPIVNLDKVFDIGIHIHPIPTHKILKEFKKKVAEVQSQINTRQSKGLVRDPVLDTAFRDLEQLRDGLQQAQEKIFSVGLYITIYADDEDELFKSENEIRSMLEGKLIYLKPALFQQSEAFLSVAPIGEDKLAIHTKLNTGPVSSFFPFISSELTDNKGILYGINRHNSGLVIFDRYSLPNYNSITFATSGAGKSYATKLEILRTMMFDTEVIIIDPEREYEYLAEAVGGRYFNISLSSEHHINPFDIPQVADDEDPADVLRTHIIHLVGLFRIMLNGLSPEEDSIIDRAITETYALKDITFNSDYSGIEPPLMSDFEMVLSSMEGADSLLTRLTKYTKGTWSGFINKPSNVDINKKLVVFSIRDMEDELKPAAMYIITAFIWNAVRRNIKKTIIGG